MRFCSQRAVRFALITIGLAASANACSSSVGGPPAPGATTPPPSSAVITEYKTGALLPGAGPITDRDGNQRFLAHPELGFQIYTLVSVSSAGVVKRLKIRPARDYYATYSGLTIASDQRLWVEGTIGKGNSTALSLVKVPTLGPLTKDTVQCTATAYCFGGGIAAGSDGNFWIINSVAVERAQGLLFKVSTTGRLLQTIQLGKGVVPNTIANGPDQELWLGASIYRGTSYANAMLRVTTSGIVTRLGPVPEPVLALASGQDGNMWFADGSNYVERMSPSGKLSRFFVAAHAETQSIAQAPDGTLWTTELGRNRIGHIAANGAVIARYPIPSASANPSGINVAPDGTVWFLETFYQPSPAGQVAAAGIAKLTPASSDQGATRGGLRITTAGTAARIPAPRK